MKLKNYDQVGFQDKNACCLLCLRAHPKSTMFSLWSALWVLGTNIYSIDGGGPLTLVIKGGKALLIERDPDVHLGLCVSSVSVSDFTLLVFAHSLLKFFLFCCVLDCRSTARWIASVFERCLTNVLVLRYRLFMCCLSLPHSLHFELLLSVFQICQ